MSYRDDLSAARSRIRELERELAAAQRRIAELERPKKRSDEPPVTRREPTGPRRVLGRIYFQRPWSYVPLLRWLYVGFFGAWPMKPKAPDSDSLIAWVWHYGLAFPLYFILFLPLFYLVLVPNAALLAVVASPFALIGMVMAGLKVGDRPRRTQPQVPEWAREPRAAARSIMITAFATAPIEISVLAGVASCLATG